MKTRLVLAAAFAGLFALAEPAHAQQDLNNPQPTAQQSAQAPAASTVDDSASYGGTPSTRGMSSKGYRPESYSNCIPGLSCNIYQGS